MAADFFHSAPENAGWNAASNDFDGHLHPWHGLLSDPDDLACGGEKKPSIQLVLVFSILKKTTLCLQWIENHDPAAIASQNESPQPPNLFAGKPYQPSYEQLLPEPLAIASNSSPTLHRTLFPPGMVPDFTSDVKNKEPSFPNILSQYAISSAVVLNHPQPFTPSRITNDIPVPARFLVAQSDRTGESAFFLLQSSGNDALDAYARQWLAKSKASLKDGSGSGWVQFYWGSELWEKRAP